MDNYDFPQIPIPKNYGEIIESRMLSMEKAIVELSNAFKLQSETLQDSISLNKELIARLQLLKPVNN